MGYIERTYCAGVRCDAKDCGAEIAGAEISFFTGKRHYERLADDAGWSFWVGRSRRAYCPDHGPSRGTKMWRAHIKPVTS